MDNIVGTRRKWMREEIILAFEIYCTVPNQNILNNPKVIELSDATGHPLGSVRALLENFKSFDPNYTKNDKKGLPHGSKLAGEVASEFFDNWDSLVIEAAEIKKRYNIKPLPESITVETDIPTGYDVERAKRARCGQSFFRQTLLTNYEGRCCITGLAISDLLIASHIKPWGKSNDINEKTNPQNGLLLNPLLDLAFDKGYITIDGDCRVILSREIKNHACEHTRSHFEEYNGRTITNPIRFPPGKQFIEYHNEHIFRG